MAGYTDTAVNLKAFLSQADRVQATMIEPLSLVTGADSKKILDNNEITNKYHAGILLLCYAHVQAGLKTVADKPIITTDETLLEIKEIAANPAFDSCVARAIGGSINGPLKPENISSLFASAGMTLTVPKWAPNLFATCASNLKIGIGDLNVSNDKWMKYRITKSAGASMIEKYLASGVPIKSKVLTEIKNQTLDFNLVFSDVPLILQQHVVCYHVAANSMPPSWPSGERVLDEMPSSTRNLWTKFYKRAIAVVSDTESLEEADYEALSAFCESH
jgi:hypothetical protein